MGILPLLTEAIPTDGLHTDGATDEDQIGATYDELEWAMIEYDHGRRPADFMGRAREVMEIYTYRHEMNLHKMQMPPILPLDQ
jgi:NAD+ synthase